MRLVLLGSALILSACAHSSKTSDDGYTVVPDVAEGMTRYSCDGGDAEYWVDVADDGMTANSGVLLVGEYAKPGEDIYVETFLRVGTRAYLEGSEGSQLVLFNGGRAEIEDGGGSITTCFQERSPGLATDPRSMTNETLSRDGQRWTQWQSNGPVTAWGSNVRARPDVNSERIGSVAKGEVLDMIAQTSVEYQGYPWFLVRLPSGMEGYVAGGLLCSPEGYFGDNVYTANNCE